LSKIDRPYEQSKEDMQRCVFQGAAVRFAVVALFSMRAFASLTATGVLGTPEHGQQIVITGYGFGTNTLFYLLEDVESGVFQPSWGSTKNLAVSGAHQRTPYSQHNAHLNFTATQGDGFFSGPNSPNSSQWYVSYYCLFDANWDWGTTASGGTNAFLANGKVLRFWNSSSSINENFLVSYLGSQNSLVYNMEYVAGPSASGSYIGAARQKLNKGQYHHIQAEFIENTTLRASNGQFRLWIDSVLVANKTNIVTREDFVEFKRVGVIGFDSAWGPGPGENDEQPNDYYIDDIFLHDSIVRVELCATASYDGGHREDQRINHWSETTIGITVNQGSFTNGATVFVFITKSDGTRNEVGIPIRIGTHLGLRHSGSNVVVEWKDPTFRLQTTTNLSGPWNDVMGSPPSPFTNRALGHGTYYRLAR
jgi:hypothetical protein